MSRNPCSYDCAEHPDHISPYPDISGIGVGAVELGKAVLSFNFVQVVIGYMGSAAIVVSIIIIYYLTSFDPGKDPFRKEDGTCHPNSSSPFRENPFDVVVLGLGRTIKNVLKQKRPISPSTQQKKQRNPRLEAAYVKACKPFSYCIM